MTDEFPRRRASDRPATSPFEGNAFTPEQPAEEELQERRQRDVEWLGPERRSGESTGRFRTERRL
jgi:hypothetical protein